jgi:hypothetical protein
VQQLPFHDSTFDRGVKRTYWTQEQANMKKSQLSREAAAMTSKRDRQYSHSDQQKIAAEKWQAVCEAKPKSPDEA